jgi:hypothetical protein
MTLDQDEEEKRKVCPIHSGDRTNGKKESQEENENGIDLLQWYLKMIIESE